MTRHAQPQRNGPEVLNTSRTDVPASDIHAVPGQDSASGYNLAATFSDRMNTVLADTLALYLKTKHFHQHMSGPHFRD